MEVHHHPDLHHQPKPWKEYFLEFLMIFLAVTMGFIAENVRETISDNEKGKEYIIGLVQNLKDDTTNIAIVIKENEEKLSGLHALMLLSQKDLSSSIVRKQLYQNCSRAIGFYSNFKSNDATMQQLKNSGGLRYIKKDHTADSIARYFTEIETIYSAGDIYLNATNLAVLASHDLLDYSVYYDTSYNSNGEFKAKLLPLLTSDKTRQKIFFNKIDFEIAATRLYIWNLSKREPYIKSLINYLKKEYNLDKE